MDQLALIFLLAGLGLVLIIFIVAGLIIYAWQRSKRRRVHIENIAVTNKNFDSQSRYSKTDSTEYITSGRRSPGLALSQHFHHGLGIPKKTFEAPSAPLTPPSSTSPTSSLTADLESTKAKNTDPTTTGSLRSVVVIDDETESTKTENLKEMEFGSEKDVNENHSQPIHIPIQIQQKRPETAPSPNSPRERNFLIEIPSDMDHRQSVSAGGRRTNSETDSSAIPHRFSQQMEKLQENENERLYSEFDNLNQQVILKASDTSQTLKNIRKNRYYDILPYDENRVKLTDLPNDYINASYIRDQDGQSKYIAAQGPIGESECVGGRRDCTVPEFWHMIWQEKVDCVVMLTECVENRRQKCARYWPENVDENEKIDDNLSMNLYCYTEDEVCFMREIWLEKKGEGTRKIVQWHYKNWNDAEGPTSNQNFLEFIDNIRKSTKKSPILVHCSAGVGRTGVFIGLDMLLDNLESESIIDVHETVQSLRKARSNMVQNHEQYLTLYELIAEKIQRLQ